MLIARGHGEHVAIRMGESIVSPRHQTRAKFIAHIDTHISQGGLEGKEGEERRAKRGRRGGQRGGGEEAKEGGGEEIGDGMERITLHNTFTLYK